MNPATERSAVSNIGNKLRPPSFKGRSHPRSSTAPKSFIPSNSTSSAAGPALLASTPLPIGTETSSEPPTSLLHQPSYSPDGKLRHWLPSDDAAAAPPHSRDPPPLQPADLPRVEINRTPAPLPTASSQRRLRRVRLALSLAYGLVPGRSALGPPFQPRTTDHRRQPLTAPWPKGRHTPAGPGPVILVRHTRIDHGHTPSRTDARHGADPSPAFRPPPAEVQPRSPTPSTSYPCGHAAGPVNLFPTSSPPSRPSPRGPRVA